MRPAHRIAYRREMMRARSLIRARKLDLAFFHLERAHVLGQRHVIPHVITHWHMLVVGILRREPRAIFGQAVRIVLGALGSAVGSVPVGNTGGTDVSMFKRMPIAPDLERIMQPWNS